MGDSAVVSPVQNSFDKFAFADADKTSDKISSQTHSLGSPENSSRSPGGLKRPHSNSESSSMEGQEPDSKRMAAAAAAAVATGASDPYLRAAGIPRAQLPGMGMPAMMAALGPVMTEEVMVPDKMVGLIIGRGGEQISRLQAESGAKIQMAPDSAGMPERICTVTGSREAVSRAKEMIMGIVQNRGGPRDAGPPTTENLASQHSVEVMIPGPKVGLIIGKGGETIKQLQERTGTRMVVVQEGPQQENEKPLRIYGDPQKVEMAKQMVYELIADKEGDVPAFDRGQRAFGNFAGNGPQQTIEVPVPRSAVGVVIGKSGETIKKIQMETGTRIQFQQARDDVPEDRMCAVTGSPSQIQDAKQRIEDLIESVLVRDSQMGRGRGRGGANGSQFGRSPGGGGSSAWGEYGPGGGRGGPGMGMMRNGQDKIEHQFLVPANKTGIVIGKGGETIKQINQQSGAFCELDRRPPPNPNEKVFIIRGSPEQVEMAKRMITEKLGMGPMGSGASPFPLGQGPPSGGFPSQGWGGGAYQQWPGQAGELGKTDTGAAWAAYYQQQYFQQGSAPSAAGQQPGTPGIPEGGAPVNPQTGQPDYTAQWIQYYRSIGAHKDAEALEQQLKAAKGMGNPQAAAAAPAPAAAPAAGSQQQDYSAQWIAYYRSIGKIQEAEALEAQTRLKQAGQVPGQQGAGPAQAFFPGAGGLGAAAGGAAPAGAAGFYGQSGLAQPQGAYSFPGNYAGYSAPVGDQ